MGVDYQARQIYDMQIKDVTTSPEKWKSILKLAGNLYRYEFDNDIVNIGLHFFHKDVRLYAASCSEV